MGFHSSLWETLLEGLCRRLSGPRVEVVTRTNTPGFMEESCEYFYTDASFPERSRNLYYSVVKILKKTWNNFSCMNCLHVIPSCGSEIWNTLWFLRKRSQWVENAQQYIQTLHWAQQDSFRCLAPTLPWKDLQYHITLSCEVHWLHLCGKTKIKATGWSYIKEE